MLAFNLTRAPAQLRQTCEAHGVELFEGDSGEKDTDLPLATWGPLHDAVDRDPEKYGGAYQGPGNSGVLQVVPGRTELHPGSYAGGHVATMLGIPAADLMVDVTVVECRYSRADLLKIRNEIETEQLTKPTLGIVSSEIRDSLNAVEVGVTRLGAIAASHFDRYGDAVVLREVAPPSA